MALTAAEYFAVDKGEKVLVLLTDMTLYADALAIVSNRMDQIPSKDSMPGSLYSDLAKIYEKAVQLPNGGSITIIAVTTLSGGDITHAIPDNTGYITEGQLFLRNDSDTGKVIVDPFRSLSRLKQLVIGKKTREDHPQVMNACVRLYADAANAKTKLENGFDLSDYDERAEIRTRLFGETPFDRHQHRHRPDARHGVEALCQVLHQDRGGHQGGADPKILEGGNRSWQSNFNITRPSLGDLGKQLKMRQKALPTIKSKESALRSEVKKAKEAAQEFRSSARASKAEYDYMVSLWGEFDCDLFANRRHRADRTEDRGRPHARLPGDRLRGEALRPLLVARMVRRRDRPVEAAVEAGHRVRTLQPQDGAAGFRTP